MHDNHVTFCFLGDPQSLADKKKRKKKKKGLGKKGRGGESSGEEKIVSRPVVNAAEGEMPDGAASSDDDVKKGHVKYKARESVVSLGDIDLRDALNQNLDM